jgi:hypothetical protein
VIPYNLRQPFEKERPVVEGGSALVVCDPRVVRHLAVLAIQLRECLDVIAGEGDRDDEHVFFTAIAQAS